MPLNRAAIDTDIRDGSSLTQLKLMITHRALGTPMQLSFRLNRNASGIPRFIEARRNIDGIIDFGRIHEPWCRKAHCAFSWVPRMASGNRLLRIRSQRTQKTSISVTPLRA
jgi:hypothetical protein